MITLAKMTNGDLVVYELTNQTDENVTVKRPLKIVMTPQGVALIPYMLGAAEEEFTIAKSHFIISVKPDRELEKVYIQQTSNIVTANNQDLANMNIGEISI